MLENKDQLAGFFIVVGYLLLTNIGLVIGAVRGYFRKLAKLDKDVNMAFFSIRELRQEIKEVKQLLTEQREDKTQGGSP